MSEDPFVEAVKHLREQYAAARDKSNLFGPSSKRTIDVTVDRTGGVETESLWLGEDDKVEQFVRLVDIPNTLSGDILRLRQQLPAIDGHFEVNGDVIRPISTPPPLPEWPDDSDDPKDLQDVLAPLPLIAVDPSKHHTKKGKYASEVHNLLLCQGGQCPGQPITPHIIQLLGKSSEGELVFEKLVIRQITGWRFCSLRHYKIWIKQLLTALKVLHSLGIVHRDVKTDNVVFSEDGERLVLCDLEGHWGLRSAPEIAREDTLDSGWTMKSDIYDIGVFIEHMIYANVPVSSQVEWPVPAPFDAIVEVCKRADPQQRPSLDELLGMVDSIGE